MKIARFFEDLRWVSDRNMGHAEASHFAGKTKEGMKLVIIQEALASPIYHPRLSHALIDARKSKVPGNHCAPAHSEAPWRKGKTFDGSERRAIFLKVKKA